MIRGSQARQHNKANLSDTNQSLSAIPPPAPPPPLPSPPARPVPGNREASAFGGVGRNPANRWAEKVGGVSPEPRLVGWRLGAIKPTSLHTERFCLVCQLSVFAWFASWCPSGSARGAHVCVAGVGSAANGLRHECVAGVGSAANGLRQECGLAVLNAVSVSQTALFTGAPGGPDPFPPRTGLHPSDAPPRRRAGPPLSTRSAR